mgnify:CR=1 FL=1
MHYHKDSLEHIVSLKAELDLEVSEDVVAIYALHCVHEIQIPFLGPPLVVPKRLPFFFFGLFFPVCSSFDCWEGFFASFFCS